MVTAAAPAPSVQGTFDDLGRTLAEVTFCVVDLETTGGSATSCAITEVGAVKVRAGVVLGEFQTLVDPGTEVPPGIAVLTGITSAMLVGAPTVRAVLPAFLEFARGCVLVAHNAPFDISFLRAAAAGTGHDWPAFEVVDTVQLARRLVGPDESPDRRLGSLARLFRAGTTPEHRALADARATVDVLHALLGRLGNVRTLEELQAWVRTDDGRRARRHLAAGLPATPGVYRFLDPQGRTLYVGSSADLRARVGSYFTASERRRRMTELVTCAASVEHVPCPTLLEARVRELRLIAEHRPPHNRRSTRPERSAWLKLTHEPVPRLSVVQRVGEDHDSAQYVGLFSSRGRARLASEAVYAAFRLRQCAGRLPRRGGGSACVLAGLGRCTAPCVGGVDAAYAAVVSAVRHALTTDLTPLVESVLARVRRLSVAQRYEEAALERDRLGALTHGLDRAQQMAALARCGEVVLANRGPLGGWELACVRHGRLAGTASTRPGEPVRGTIDALRATAEVVVEPTRPGTSALSEESALLVRRLEAPGTRLVSSSDGWHLPLGAAARWSRLVSVGAAPTRRAAAARPHRR